MRWIYLTCVLVLYANGMPTPKGRVTDKMFSFMKKYGYIEEGGLAEAQYTEDSLLDVIKTIQRFGALPETGIIDNATEALMSKPRCGVPDVIRGTRRKRFTPARSGGWKKREITFYIANWSPSLDRETVRKNIILALDTWGRYGRLRFKEVFDPSADIIVAFARGYHNDRNPFDGPGNILAHAFFPNEYESLGGDIHFDDDEKWVDKYNSDEEGVHFYTVALHELGHSLGLSHSIVQSSIMFPYYRGGDDNNFALDYDDILGMYELYIRNGAPDDTTPRREDEYDYDSSSEKSEEDSDEEENEEPFHPSTEAYSTTTSRYDSSSIYPSTTYRSEIENHTVTYHGDTETVDDHKNHDDKVNLPTTNAPSLPDICQGHYDAVATLRDELFIFKEQYVWRLREKMYIERGYPIQIWQMFPDLPKTIKKIDAAYERPDGMIIIFTGHYYWVFNGNSFIEGSPRPLTDYGLPKSLKRLDAVQNWAKNRKTYLYYKNEFWRYNETSKSMDNGYPMKIGRWRGVPENLDAATTWKDGITYFFKGKLYWKFDNDWVIVTDKSPLPSPQIWLGCPQEVDERPY